MKPSTSSRLLLTPPLTAAENMALDELLLQRVVSDGPVVRLYSWSPPAVSLGYGQRSGEVDLAACCAHGIDVTRRLTGGRAVLHHQEITYSVVVEAERLGVGRSVTRAYQLLTAGLIRALAVVGIAAACHPRPATAATERDPACFATTIGGDLSVAGRKLIGSAQCHRFGGILQHGSLPIRIDEALLTACLHRPPGAARHWTCLDELGVELSVEDLAEPLADGLGPVLGSRPTIGTPTAAELADLAALAPKYRSDDWVLRL